MTPWSIFWAGWEGGKVSIAQLAPPKNAHQKVVEIVGDSARQPADAFEFLLLEGGILGPLLVLDLRTGAEPVGNLSGGGPQGNGAHEMPSVAAVSGPA